MGALFQKFYKILFSKSGDSELMAIESIERRVEII